MTEPVKKRAAKKAAKRASKKTPKTRSYTSTVRQEQAAGTRQRILDAANECFLTDGYGRTTVAGIARAAEVAPDTIYKTFGSKGRVLTALIDRRLAPPGTANVMQRPEAQAVRDEPDRRRQIELFAHDMAAVGARVRPMYEILRTASAVEPEMADVYAEMNGYRLRNMRAAVEWFASRGPLRVDIEQAIDIVWTVASPEVGRLLCEQRGWTDDQYATWLADTIASALLPASERDGGGGSG